MVSAKNPCVYRIFFTNFNLENFVFPYSFCPNKTNGLKQNLHSYVLGKRLRLLTKNADSQKFYGDNVNLFYITNINFISKVLNVYLFRTDSATYWLGYKTYNDLQVIREHIKKVFFLLVGPQRFFPPYTTISGPCHFFFFFFSLIMAWNGF